MTTDDKMSIIDVTSTSIRDYGTCGYKDPRNPGYQRKLKWLAHRFEEGMRLKILHSKSGGAVGSIEYLPGEYAWRGVRAPGYMVIHCMFIMKRAYKGKGYGQLLIEACEKDSLEQKKYGVAAVASESTWMAKKEIFLKNGYVLTEEAPPHFQLLVKRFNENAPLPSFLGGWEEKLSRYPEGLTIIYSDQCPYVTKAMA